MTLETQLDHFDNLVAQMRLVLINKGSDYAGEDKLSNFKTAGPNAGLTPEQNCLSLIATKVARLGTLFNSNKPPSNEAISDSVMDLANYSILLHMIINEQNEYEKLPF